jgi:hypothetical protein
MSGLRPPLGVELNGLELLGVMFSGFIVTTYATAWKAPVQAGDEGVP